MAGSRLTQSGLLIGSPEYMAPEQITGASVDPVPISTRWASCMYEMFSGTKPFVADTPVKVLFQHLEGEAEPARTAREGPAPGLEELVRRAMARDPDGRPARRRGVARPDRRGARPAPEGRVAAMARIDAFLKLAREQGCSDIHFTVGRPPLVRLDGELAPLKYRDLTRGEWSSLLTEILEPSLADQLDRDGSVDLPYAANGLGRFRLQRVPPAPRARRDLPPACPTACRRPPISACRACVSAPGTLPSGLVLVTGGPGTGKTTTLAALIDEINENRNSTSSRSRIRSSSCTSARSRWSSSARWAGTCASSTKACARPAPGSRRAS